MIERSNRIQTFVWPGFHDRAIEYTTDIRMAKFPYRSNDQIEYLHMYAQVSIIIVRSKDRQMCGLVSI